MRRSPSLSGGSFCTFLFLGLICFSMTMNQRALRRNNFELPIDLIFDIFARFPVKKLIQFKSVCKTWYAIIENPNFIKMYHQRIKQNPKPTLTSVLVTDCDYETRLYSMWLQSRDKIRNPIPNPNFLFRYYPRIVGICDGLVCAIFDECDAIICNPTTGRVRKTAQFSLPKMRSDIVFFGFGLHENEYKLFRFVYSASQSEVLVRAEMYSMRIDVWIKIEVKKGVIDMDKHINSVVSFNPTPVVVNEVLYWRAYSSHVPCVVSFDMNGYVFGVIACHVELIEPCKVQWQLVDLKGELALTTCRKTFWFELWVLNEKERSWTIKLKTENLPLIGRSLKCLGCEKNGNLVLQYYSSEMDIQLFSYDAESGDFIYLAFAGMKEKHYDVYLYTESLLAI